MAARLGMSVTSGLGEIVSVATLARIGPELNQWVAGGHNNRHDETALPAIAFVRYYHAEENDARSVRSRPPTAQHTARAAPRHSHHERPARTATSAEEADPARLTAAQAGSGWRTALLAGAASQKSETQSSRTGRRQGGSPERDSRGGSRT